MEDTIPSIVDGGAGRDDHVGVGDDGEFEDEQLVGDDELTTFERSLFAAVRSRTSSTRRSTMSWGVL